MKSPRPRQPEAFSLVEMLVVIALMAIVATFAMSGLAGVQRGMALTDAGSRLADYLAIGRQTAMSLNQPVEVWFCPGEPQDSLLLYRIENGVAKPVEKELKVNEQITLSANEQWSSVLTTAVSGPKAPRPKLPAADCHSFRFMPDGSTDLGGAAWATITLIPRTAADAASLPANFFTVQIDQQTGTIRTFRPQ
jgi:uncharacterized protein (TIGR02596 family)